MKTIIIILSQIIMIGAATMHINEHIKEHIEKHSVHPQYGNYKKTDSKGRSCQPWDSCR